MYGDCIIYSSQLKYSIYSVHYFDMCSASQCRGSAQLKSMPQTSLAVKAILCILSGFGKKQFYIFASDFHSKNDLLHTKLKLEKGKFLHNSTRETLSVIKIVCNHARDDTTSSIETK